MSFSYALKQEILQNKPMRARNKQAQAYGLFLFGRAFREDEISLRTENEETARLFRRFAEDFLGKATAFSEGEIHRNGKITYTVELPLEADRLRLLHLFGQGEGVNRERLTSQERLGAFLAGAYLACGNIADPEKSYHLEFVVREPRLCRDLAELLGEAIPGARISGRRQTQIVYYKECGPIEDLMTLMGAPRSCLEVIDIETVKSVRNRANRAVNCETANIDKLVGAAAAQMEDIRLLLEAEGRDGLPESLVQVAMLRLQNPEASLRELAELSPEPISRSGIHHRLDRLSRMAAELRGRTGPGKGGNPV